MRSLGIIYCEGWSGSVVGPLLEATARGRHDAGEQFAVMLLDGDQPVALVEVCWQESYACAWHFDSSGRRHRKLEFRLSDQLVLRKVSVWEYLSPEQAEFSESANFVECDRNGDTRKTIHIGGGVSQSTLQAEPFDLVLPVPSFGDWQAIAGLDDVVLSPLEVVEVAAPPPWHPPRPLCPVHLSDVFRDGAQFALPDAGKVTVEVRDAGTLVLPSGRLAAADPGWLDADEKGFVVAVEPGSYAVRLSVIRFEDQPSHTRVAAGAVVVRSEPVTSWEMALCPGQDPKTLGEGHFFGFGVDAGMACFFDASAAPAFHELAEDLDDVPASLVDPSSGANLIAFPSGWGDGAYPTWIGRTASGDVACFVADMLILHYGTLVS